MPEQHFRFDFALSFAGSKRATAEELRTKLTEAGFQVFYDRDYEHEMLGSDGIEYLAQVYSKESQYCVVLISQDYDRGSWTRIEREYIQARGLKNKKQYLIPVMLDDHRPEWLPASRIFFDLATRTVAELVERLALRAGPTRLLLSVKSANRLERQYAVQALAEMKSLPPGATPALIALLADGNLEISVKAFEALEKVGLAAIPALLTALSDRDRRVREGAAGILATISRNFGPAASEAIPALITALGDSDREVRSVAARALRPFGPAAVDAVPALISLLADPWVGKFTLGMHGLEPALDRLYNRYAAEALGSIGVAAVPALITALRDLNEEVRCDAAYALGLIGPAAVDAVPALDTALKDECGGVRGEAKDALQKIQSPL